MEKVTVNGISDKDIYDDVGKQKSYINISNYQGGDSTMEKSNGKYRESNKNPLRIDL